MLKQIGISIAALVIVWPSEARGQTQQTKVPIAKSIVSKTAAVKTRQKKSALVRPSAAQRGLTPDQLTTVVAPNGDVRVVRKKNAAK